MMIMKLDVVHLNTIVFKGNVEDLDPHSAFGTGIAMGQSGDFDDESEQDDNLPLISYLKEFFATQEKH